MRDIIREALALRAEDIKADEKLLRSIYDKTENSREVFRMNKKLFIAVCGAVVIGATGVMAGGLRKSVESHADRREAINHFPTAEEVMDTVGYLPKYVEELPGGYKFESAQPSERTDKDENGNVIKEAKDIDFNYDAGDKEKILVLSTEEGEYPVETSDNTEIIDIDGTEVSYTHFTYMAVPPDYEPTAEELAAEEAGTLQIGYGSSEIEIVESNSLIWTMDGITYNLLSMGLDLTKAELTDMAKAVINS